LLKIPKRNTRLNCWYDRTSTPERILRPFKKERLSVTPEAYLVYDSIGESTMNRVLDLSENLGCFSVNPRGEDYFEVVRRPISTAVCMLRKEDTEDLKEIVERIAGVDLHEPGSYEGFHVNEYVYGRLFTVHNDAFNVRKDKS